MQKLFILLVLAFFVTGSNVYAQNFKTEKEYYKTIDSGMIPTSKGYRLSEDDRIRRDVIMKIMCDFELNMSSMEEKQGINFSKYFAYGLEALKIFIDDGLVTIDGNMIRISEMGRLLIRNIAMSFDGYIERKEDAGRYSRTV